MVPRGAGWGGGTYLSYMSFRLLLLLLAPSRMNVHAWPDVTFHVYTTCDSTAPQYHVDANPKLQQSVREHLDVHVGRRD